MESYKKWREEKDKIFIESKDKPTLTVDEVNAAFNDIVIVQKSYEEEIDKVIKESAKNKNYPKLYRNNDNTSNYYIGFLAIPGIPEKNVCGFFKIVAIGTTQEEINNNVKKYIEKSNTSDVIILSRDNKWIPLLKNPTKFSKNNVVLDRETKVTEEDIVESFETLLQTKKEYLSDRKDDDLSNDVDFKYSKHFASIKHLDMSYQFMLKKSTLFEKYIKMKYELYRRDKPTDTWYDCYFKEMNSIGSNIIDSKEMLCSVVQKYENDDYISLSDKELITLLKTTIDDINKMSVF